MFDQLKFNVAQLLRDPVGASRTATFEVDLYQLVPELAIGLETVPEATLTGSVRMVHTNTGILTRGHVSAVATAACARCLEPVQVALDFDLEEVYAPTVDIVTGKTLVPDEEDRALWIDEHHILDLAEVLRQNALITMPLHILCRPDCRGLCPTCGHNLNEGPCSCQTETDPRWAVLADLLKDLNP
ncbi:MAG: YceD family protein [Anaerolineae bacterium]